MAGINRNKISAKLYKQLDKKGLLKEVIILRTGLNAYKEKQEDLYVCTVKGFYYRKDTKILVNSDVAGTINNQYDDRLLVICNVESIKMKNDDYFVLDNVKYTIKDLNNKENIILDMYIDRK